MKQREVYLHKLQTQMDEWNAALDQLKDRAEQVEADAKADYDGQINDLQHKQYIVQKKLEELRQASDDAWESLKFDVEDASNRLGESVNLATSRFK